MKSTGEKIRSARKRQGITLQQLANEIGVSISAVSQYERGKINPDAFMIFKIAKALKCSLLDIVPSSEIGKLGTEITDFLNVIPPDMAANDDLSRIRFEKELELLKIGAFTCTFIHEGVATSTDGNAVEVVFNDKKGKPFYIPFEVVYRILEIYEELNEEGQEKALRYLFDLQEIPRYRQEVTACPEDAPQTAADCNPGSDPMDAGNADSRPE